MKTENMEYLREELENFETISKILINPPGSIPELDHIDIYGECLPVRGIVGGDHIIFVDFKKRYDIDTRIEIARKKGRKRIEEKLVLNASRAGILILDVSGHSITDAYLAGRLHDAFLTGVLYELHNHGEVTTRLFEVLNTRFYDSLTIDKYLTLLYGEISTRGKFRFISAGHPVPVVFSHKYDRIVEISSDRLVTYPPLGMFPSEDDIDKRRHFSQLGYKKRYTVNEINLMDAGDIILLYTDGLSEYHRNDQEYFPERLEKVLRKTKRLNSREIFEAVKEDIMKFSPPEDDVSYVVIKKTA